eukprot:10398528-Karenia_brevis.AAC.1
MMFGEEESPDTGGSSSSNSGNQRSREPREEAEGETERQVPIDPKEKLEELLKQSKRREESEE